MSSQKWMALGAVLTTAGSGLAVAYLMYVLQPGLEASFWEWPGVLGLVLLGAGVIAVLVGLRYRDLGQGPNQQHQSGGRESRNFQAGRDINVHSVEGE